LAKKKLISNENLEAKNLPPFSFEKVASQNKSKRKTKYGPQQSMLPTSAPSTPVITEQKEPAVSEELIEQIDHTVPEKVEVVTGEEKQKLEDANKFVTKTKTKKKKILNILFLILNIAIVVAILFGQSQQGEGVISFQTLWDKYLNFGKVLILIGMWLLVMICEAIKYEILIHDLTKRHRFGVAFKLAGIGRYYDSVTPMATGGQPFQVFYLKSRGLSAADSISVPVGRYVFGQIVFVVFAIIIAIASIRTGSTTGNVAKNVVSAASWVGIGLNAGLIFLIAFLTISKTISQKIVRAILKLLQKMKIIKNYEKQFEKVNKVVLEFQTAFKTFAKNKSTLVLEFLFSIIGTLLNYSIPFVIYSVLVGYNPAVWSEILMLCVMVDMAASFFILPGGTGVTELSFTTLLASLFSGGLLFWALIIWRILTYYLYIIQGPIIMIWDYLIGNKHQAWQNRKWELEEESKGAAIREQLSIFDKIK